MNFNDVFSQISKRQGPGFGAGLCAFSQLLSRLNNPQNPFQIIHVAGTNGKGSVCTLLARALTCAGYTTGLFVSPHLISPTERISLDGKEILAQDFMRCVGQVLAAEKEPLNFFEILTATAFLYFAEKKVQYVVLETGLGGRKDPTNICKPLASVITSIGLDHTQLLGETLEQIATEKAGIIKPGIPVFCGPVALNVREVIARTARNQKTSVYFVKEGEPFSLKEVDCEKGCLLLKKEGKIYPLHLLGKFQPANACLVWQVLRFLNVPEQAILKAFATVRIPGRFEVIHTFKNTFILDGAHNPQAVEALLEFWKQTPYCKKATLVCGFMKDKNFKEMFTLLATHFKQIILTVPPSSRAAGLAELGELLNRPGVCFEADLALALRRAGELSPAVLCTGSFYVVAAALQVIKNTLKTAAGLPS